MTEETESVDKALVEAKSQPTLPLPFIEKWFDNQSQEIKNKQREIDLQKQTDGNNFEYAKLALNAQAKDSQDDRTHLSKRHNRNLTFIGLLVVAMLGFLVYSLHTGKDQIALEIVKAVVFIASGGAGGYALGIIKSKHRTNGDQ